MICGGPFLLKRGKVFTKSIKSFRNYSFHAKHSTSWKSSLARLAQTTTLCTKATSVLPSMFVLVASPTLPPMAIFRRSDFTFSTPFWTEENSSQSSLPGRRIVSSLLGMGNVSSSLSRYHWMVHGEVLIKYETPSPPQTLTQNSPLLNEK